MDEKKSAYWFSAHFGIHQPQYKLPFVDFLLNGDVPLYLDSYAIAKDGSDLSVRCHKAIVSYFQAIVDAAKQKDEQRVQALIRGRLSEPKAIHLGVSKKARAGIGLGPVQEGQIIQAITQSSALTSGVIQDIQELELHIDGLGPDKVSDLIANIIKGHLAEFTQGVCRDYQVETRSCVVDFFWDSDALEWTSDRYNLPARAGDSYILVPKDFVRQDLANHNSFFDQYMLDFYTREKQSAADSLAASLQKSPPRITKASVRQDPSISSKKSFVSRFIQDHPEIIEKYRAKLRQEPNPIDFARLSGKADVDNHLIDEVLEKLDRLPTGTDHAQAYQDLISECLLFAFDWYLKQVEHGRIDIRSETSARNRLSLDRLHAPAILMESENGPLEQSTLQQFAERLSLETGLFGFLFCRRIAKLEELTHQITELFTADEKCILVFDDYLVHDLVERKRNLGYKGVESLLHRMIHLVMYGEEIYQVLYGADQLPRAGEDKKS